MFMDELNIMLDDLKRYSNADKDSLLSYYVQDRLSKSLETYYNQLTNSIEYLERKNELSVLKRVGK